MKKYLNLDFKQNQVLKYLNKFTYLAFFVFLFSACETESYDQPSQSPEQILKEQFSFDTFQDSPGLSKDNFIINWDSHITKKINTSVYYEFDIDTKYRSQLDLEGYVSTHTYHLIARFDEDNNPEYYISKQLPLKTNTQFDVSYINMIDYSGMAYLYTGKGQKFSVEVYKNGDIKGQWVEEELRNNQVVRSGDGCTIPFLRFNDLEENEQLPNRCSGGGCHTGTKTVQHWTYWYDVEVDNNTGVIVSATYSHRELTGTTTEHYHVCGGGSTSIVVNSNVAKPNPTPEGFNDVDIIPPPDCESFQYEQVSSNWKATVSKNLNFNVRILVGVNTTNVIDHDIDFGNELFTFQTWNVDRFNNELDGQSAAIVTAFAVQQAVFQTQHDLKHQYGISPLQIEQHFKMVLKRDFPNYTGGGRVEIGNPYGLTPIEFDNRWYGFGDCD